MSNDSCTSKKMLATLPSSHRGRAFKSEPNHHKFSEIKIWQHSNEITNNKIHQSKNFC